MIFKNIIIESVGSGVSFLKVNRPKALNALNIETLDEMMVALVALEKDPQVRVVVLSGEGEKAFIAGADISEMKALTSGSAVVFSKKGQDVTKKLELMAKPTIAAVSGFALGGGTEMAIACDFIFASETAVFGQPEVSLGVIPGFGGTVRLSKFVGLPKAKELIFSGRRVLAQEALVMGLVNQVFPQSTFLKSVIAAAKQISANSGPAIKRAKQLLDEFSETTGLSYKLDSEAQEFGGLFGSADQKEGMAAFLEKRKATFEGVTL